MEKNMKVKLINYSKAGPWLSIPNANLQDMICYCARVSNPSNQTNIDTNEKLIRYLIRNKHWSPFEMVSVCLEINTTRDIARQILRHRSFSFQEFSQRYADPTKSLSFEVREARLQDEKNRQNSIETADTELHYQWEEQQREVIRTQISVYEWAIKSGIAKEVARSVLSEGLIESRLYMHGTLRSWLHYIELRSGNGTQKEHRELAVAAANAIEPVFPMIKEFLADEV